MDYVSCIRRRCQRHRPGKKDVIKEIIMGKGSTPRPFEVPRDQFRDNWDKIFGKKNKPEPQDKKDTK